MQYFWVVTFLVAPCVFGQFLPVTKIVELPTAAPRVEKFNVKKSQDVVDVMKTNSTKNQELVPILQKMINSMSKSGNLSDAGQSMLNDMLVNFTRQSEQAASENNQTLTDEELKQVVKGLGLKENETNYEVMKTKEGNIKIIVEEIETDDPTAKDQIVLDYKKTVDKTVMVDGQEQEDDSP